MESAIIATVEEASTPDTPTLQCSRCFTSCRVDQVVEMTTDADKCQSLWDATSIDDSSGEEAVVAFVVLRESDV